MKNILIVGSSRIINKTFSFKYKNYNIENIDFRFCWDNSIQKNSDLVIISGFHYKICSCSIKSLKKYINSYTIFLNKINLRAKKIELIFTKVQLKYSFSRVVYFYYHLYNKIKNNKKIKIFSFAKIIENKNLKIIKLFNFFNIRFTQLETIIYKTKNFELKKINYIKFYFIKCPRPRAFDRFLRLLDL
jgi:hypothetical protein